MRSCHLNNRDYILLLLLLVLHTGSFGNRLLDGEEDERPFLSRPSVIRHEVSRYCLETVLLPINSKSDVLIDCFDRKFYYRRFVNDRRQLFGMLESRQISVTMTLQ